MIRISELHGYAIPSAALSYSVNNKMVSATTWQCGAQCTFKYHSFFKNTLYDLGTLLYISSIIFIYIEFPGNDSFPKV